VNATQSQVIEIAGTAMLPRDDDQSEMLPVRLKAAVKTGNSKVY